MSLRMTPPANHATSTTTPRHALAPSAPVHDSLRAGPSNVASQINARHPLESRLQNWDATQSAIRLESMRRIYGIAEPVRRGMEVVCCNEGVRCLGFGGLEEGIGMDILLGTDTKIDVGDVWNSREMARGGEYQEVMAKRVVGGGY